MPSDLDPARGFGPRPLFDDVHQAFRESVRRFAERELQPHAEEWDRAGLVPTEIYARAGELGFVGMAVGEEHGGAAAGDFRFNQILSEEMHRAGVTGFGLGLCNHNDVCLPYLLEYASAEQRDRWLPDVAAGRRILAIAMTEPGTGSDLAGISTRAVRDGGDWIVNGSKTFITCGWNADLAITAVRTGPGERHAGLSLMVLERDMPGYQRGRRLEKIGQHGVDTAELFFEDVRVPAENVLGEVGRGFAYLMSNLAQERISIAVMAVATARAALAETLEYVQDRRAFGRAVAEFQATKFSLADMAAEIDVAQTYVDDCVRALVAGELSPERAAAAKLWVTEMQGRVVDRCVQLHGGYGYMQEYAVARRYVDARVTRIYGGTSEIMREIVGRALLAR